MDINELGEWVLGDYALASHITTHFRRHDVSTRNLHEVGWLLSWGNKEDYDEIIGLILRVLGREGEQNTFRVLGEKDYEGRTPTLVIDIYHRGL